MKILGILGSPRIGGNSDILLEEALRGLQRLGQKPRRLSSQKKDFMLS